jgi:hypothetical protein
MTETLIPLALTEAVKALWCIPPPGPDNLLSDPRFVRLCNTCANLYPQGGPSGPLDFALLNASRALGLPCRLVPANVRLALAPETAAARLDAAFRRTQTSHIHLCPLDQAYDLPALKFGPNRIQKFTNSELNALVDPARLERVNPNWIFDAKRFSEFSWLMVEESRPLEQRSKTRPRTLLSMIIDLNEDRGRIEPHQARFPTAVEAALIALLVAPWEDWAQYAEDDWRGFRIPWVYAFSDDIFVRPSPPPSPDSLSWEPDFIHDQDGNVVFETERPARPLLFNAAETAASIWLTDTAWSGLARTHQSPLFETPIAHFLVRAFLADGVDEFLAHITTVEAAVGLETDYKEGGATKRVAARVSALLGSKRDAEDYRRLFNIRSKFLHGRRMSAIPGKERLVARQLARRVVNAVVEAAVAAPDLQSREAYLRGLD